MREQGDDSGWLLGLSWWRDSNKTLRTSRDWVGQEEGPGWGGQRGSRQEGRGWECQGHAPAAGHAPQRQAPRSRAGVTVGFRPGAGAAEAERVPHVLLSPPPRPRVAHAQPCPAPCPRDGRGAEWPGKPPERAGQDSALASAAASRTCPPSGPLPALRSLLSRPPLRASGDLSNGAQRSPFFSSLAAAPGSSWRGASAPARDECCGRSRVQHPAGHRLVQGGVAMGISGPGAAGARAAGWGRWWSRNAVAEGWRRGPEAGPAPRRGRGRRLGGMGARCSYRSRRRPRLLDGVDWRKS